MTLRDLEVSALPQAEGRVRFDLEMYVWQQREGKATAAQSFTALTCSMTARSSGWWATS